LLIKYIKSVLWRVAKSLSYIEEARCLKVKHQQTTSKKKHCPTVCSLDFFLRQNRRTWELQWRYVRYTCCISGSTLVGALMTASVVLLLLPTVFLLVGAARIRCTFTLFHIW